MNTLLTPNVVERILSVLAVSAGFKLSGIRLSMNLESQDIYFVVTTDDIGSGFGGRVNSEWLTLTKDELIEKLIEAYPMLAPKEDTSWQQHVIEEHKALVDKIDVLEKFFDTETYEKLPLVEKITLQFQIDHMVGYARALKSRIARFT